MALIFKNNTILLFSIICLALLAIGYLVYDNSSVKLSDRTTEIVNYLQDVDSADQAFYGVKDSTGQSMDTIKIIETADNNFLAIYHTYINGSFRVSAATSTNLKDWKYRQTIASHASQPTIYRDHNAYYIAFESDTNGSTVPRTFLTIKKYESLNDVLKNNPKQTYTAPHTLTKSPQNAEGTPSISSVHGATLKLKFHYYSSDGVDKQATGTLVNMKSWTTKKATEATSKLTQRVRADGNIGDRDDFVFKNHAYTIHEVQMKKDDPSSWTNVLYDKDSDIYLPLDIRTSGESSSFANPTVTVSRFKNKKCVIVTQFIPSEGAHKNPAGSLIYYRFYE
jgi:hypothetical protein